MPSTVSPGGVHVTGRSTRCPAGNRCTADPVAVLGSHLGPRGCDLRLRAEPGRRVDRTWGRYRPIGPAQRRDRMAKLSVGVYPCSQEDVPMYHQRVESQMTTDVVTVRPGTPFKEVVRILREHRIAAAPVLDGDEVVGVVSESDLLRKEAERDGPAPFPLRILTRRAVRAAREKARAATAGALMTSPAVIVEPSTPVADAARLMERHHVAHLPVVDPSGRLCGIVSRGDLLRVFLRPDDRIGNEIRDDIIRDTMRVDPSTVDVHVADGIVDLSGRLERRSLIGILVRLCRGVDGVVDVREHLAYADDDMRIRPPMVPSLPGTGAHQV
ncbi:CBS domain-containing protein [Yinghuangia soli]|uniref:CBS domain-containing protein n=1 Tax=Yinghuangia soli TaxID=2908204 RepID=A0AA41PZR4_9ACTN|nr:CBS domain-containing protein [Yinghuangia soli]MCF2528919.1 CBS domain-containing protein [Yinghuangia soli]